VLSVRLNPEQNEEACKKDLTMDLMMLAFVSLQQGRNCTSKEQGRLQQRQDRGGEIEERKKEARTNTSWTEVVPSWGGRGQRYQIRLAGGRGRERNTCKDGCPPDTPRMRRP
jgi:hypothetical protein